MKNIKYLAIIPVLAGLLLVFPAAERAYAGGSFGISLGLSVPVYDPYPTYYSPYSSYGLGTSYYWSDDRPYWRGRSWDRHDHRFFKHRHPRHDHPRHDRHFGRHHNDRHDHGRYRGYDRW